MKNFAPLAGIAMLCLAVCLSSCIGSAGGATIKNKNLSQDTTAVGSPKALDTTFESQDVFQSCTVSDMEWTPGSAESILLDPSSSFAFTGNVLDAKSLQNGAFTPVTGERMPIRLSISSPIFHRTSIEVPDPNLSSVGDSINSLLKSGTKGTVAAQVTINASEVFSEDHLKLLVRSNFSGGFGSLSAGFDFSNKSVRSRYFLDVTQIYYSVNMNAPRAEGFFKSLPPLLTDASVAPVYVSSVKYGRRVMISVETSTTDEKTEADFHAKINGIVNSGSLDVNLFSSKFFDGKTIKVLVMGGNPNNAFKVFKAVSNRQELSDVLAADANWSLDNLGVPLAYEIRNCTDNSEFFMSQTGKFKSRSCTVKTLGDSVVRFPPIEHLCAHHTGGQDRCFGSDPNVDFNINLEIDNNVIWCNISGNMQEQGGDGTAGNIHERRKVVELPEDFQIVELSSPATLDQPRVTLGHKGMSPFNFDENRFAASLVTVIGRSDGNNCDDLFPGGCGDDIHAQIRTLQLSPIRFKYTKKINH